MITRAGIASLYRGRRRMAKLCAMRSEQRDEKGPRASDHYIRAGEDGAPERDQTEALTSNGRSVEHDLCRRLLTPGNSEVDAARRSVDAARNGIRFEFATLLRRARSPLSQTRSTLRLRANNLASFARRLRVGNLFVELRSEAMLAAASRSGRRITLLVV
jgi:hypothetical protein